jgi:isobutyryl-CoA mutase
LNNIKLITAAALFDGHDVSINIFRKLMQKRGAEVIHLGHNRSVKEIIRTAIQEDADAILISSYQGGHNEFFKYTVDSLKENNAKNILVFGGGGGVILPSEIADLEKYGVDKIYHAVDGQKIGIDGITDDIIHRLKKHKEKISTYDSGVPSDNEIKKNRVKDFFKIAKQISFFENNIENQNITQPVRELLDKYDKKKSIVIGVTGTGGSGKSSLIDELINRFLKITKDLTIGVLTVDPSKRISGGALLGDRIRYNNIYEDRVYFRSFATRQSASEISLALTDAIAVLKTCGFDLIFVETSGIGQGDSQAVDVSDYSIYVMTAEYGAPSQLDKIDMLEIANYIVINKFEKPGSEDALREVIINYIRNHNIKASHKDSILKLDVPVYGTSSNQFNNHGVNKLFKVLLDLMIKEGKEKCEIKENLLSILPVEQEFDYGLISSRRVNYLTEIADTVIKYHQQAEKQAEIGGKCFSLQQSAELIENENSKENIQLKFAELWNSLSKNSRKFLTAWEELKEKYQKEVFKYQVRNKEIEVALYNKSLSGVNIPKVALPKYKNWHDLLLFFYKENLPGYFPFTAAVFPFRRTSEDPKRQFAGEGSANRTNKRFQYLTQHENAKRLSVAFDGITLYGEDPALEPDIYGKIGESGVSICTIDDMHRLLKTFDQIDPHTSTSMTINAPAPIMLAFYFMTAFRRELKKVEAKSRELSTDEKNDLKIETFQKLRGTVQADILKEDQGQNTCIFSIDFAVKLIGDVQEYLSQNNIINYYSISISGYHIAEAGANPISQLAFTLANGFTYVEYFLNRGLQINEFAPNLSFFFSNGMEPEYSVIGRVARRIWAIAMRDLYGGNERSQKLKYHIQTSGRSLHAQEIDLNDIRTTLQALLAFYDNCNSLHTNSYDEAVTTPTEESVRRSMAIQLIVSNEMGTIKNENFNQGSFVIEELTDLVEKAVLDEFHRISQRGGVLGAMEKQYQRSKIQEESLYYEEMKQSGEYPIVGINKFVKEDGENPYDNMTITRSTNEEKEEILKNLHQFKDNNKKSSRQALEKLREIALGGGNVFEELLNTVQYASLGQITNVLYEVGGKYRRGV